MTAKQIGHTKWPKLKAEWQNAAESLPPQATRHARIICDDTGCGEWNCDDCHPETKFPKPVESLPAEVKELCGVINFGLRPGATCVLPVGHQCGVGKRPHSTVVGDIYESTGGLFWYDKAEPKPTLSEPVASEQPRQG